jgi:hypothetical protein
MIPGSANPLLLASAAAAAPTGYAISRSLRFNSADSAYLSRTPASIGNRKTWTWAGWVKRSVLSSQQWLFACKVGSWSDYLRFLNDAIEFGSYTGVVPYSITTTAVYRDPLAWIHVVAVFDSTNATASSRSRLYVNGSLVTQFSSATYPALGASTPCINTPNSHLIGGRTEVYFSGLLADVHFIDGQALDPTSFGEFDANGIWQPKAYTGTYGTNGFHLTFSDNSTAGSLGDDSSGNGNNWTVNNISVAAGAGNDSLVDVPTNGTETDTGLGGEVRGNYCTWNPLAKGNTSLSNGNLDGSTTTTINHVRGTFGITSGKWYWECTAGGQDLLIGIVNSSAFYSQYPGGDVSGWSYYANNGYKYNNGGTAYGASYSNGDVVGVAFDADTGSLTFYKNGTSQGTAFTGLTSGPYFPAVGNGGAVDRTFVANFGQRPFAYTAPSGFKALCTANLPPPVITKPSEYMDVKLYTGNGGTQTISGLEFSPDLVWIKNRAQADNNKLLDTVRGATEELESNTTDAEVTNAYGLAAFNSDGFDLDSGAEYNTSTEAYVAWTWDAGSSTAPNTDGSITSQVRANPSAGFSIVTYQGNGTLGATIGHGLGVAPHFVVTKSRSLGGGNYSWGVFHKSLGGTKYLKLNTPDSVLTSVSQWNNTDPSSTVVTLGTLDECNNASSTYVAYCFAPVEGYSAFGSYTGNGIADGPFIYTGFRPRWILIKSASGYFHWTVWDAARDPANAATRYFYPSDLNEERTDANIGVDFLSNGFKIRGTDQNYNGNENNHIYAVFAESPFQYARAR